MKEKIVNPPILKHVINNVRLSFLEVEFVETAISIMEKNVTVGKIAITASKWNAETTGWMKEKNVTHPEILAVPVVCKLSVEMITLTPLKLVILQCKDNVRKHAKLSQVFVVMIE